ncbi:uncharacterized protein LOC133856614 [Alnus glutinosa]|uniref:uncharacterized protein LOC133856614 n=1 Tax=Alnus glutinosa TaxID=3517 RepID=UPI002D7793C7|nr:uncharacterized protein LOC133856614 [Alnus glutinosa]
MDKSMLGDLDNLPEEAPPRSNAIHPQPPKTTNAVHLYERKMDKTWMTKSRGTREYRDGCRSFVDFAVSNCRIPNGNIHRPCKSCRNNQRHPPGVVLAHLTGGKGIMTTYTTWFWHGEKHVRGPVAGSYSNRSAANVACGSTEQGGNMHANCDCCDC